MTPKTDLQFSPCQPGDLSILLLHHGGRDDVPRTGGIHYVEDLRQSVGRPLNRDLTVKLMVSF